MVDIYLTVDGLNGLIENAKIAVNQYLTAMGSAKPEDAVIFFDD